MERECSWKWNNKQEKNEICQNCHSTGVTRWAYGMEQSRKTKKGNEKKNFLRFYYKSYRRHLCEVIPHGMHIIIVLQAILVMAIRNAHQLWHGYVDIVDLTAPLATCAHKICNLTLLGGVLSAKNFTDMDDYIIAIFSIGQAIKKSASWSWPKCFMDMKELSPCFTANDNTWRYGIGMNEITQCNKLNGELKVERDSGILRLTTHWTVLQSNIAFIPSISVTMTCIMKTRTDSFPFPIFSRFPQFEVNNVRTKKKQ